MSGVHCRLATVPCDLGPKFEIRKYLIIAWIIIVFIFAFADRESKYTAPNVIKKVSFFCQTSKEYLVYAVQVYDESIIPRVAIACVMIYFTIRAIDKMIDEANEKFEVSKYDISFPHLTLPAIKRHT